MSYRETAETAEVIEKIKTDLDEATKHDLSVIELGVLATGYTLADAIRDGARHTTQVYGWGQGTSACALSAAVLAARAAGYIPPTGQA